MAVETFSIDNVKAIGLENFLAGIGQVPATWERFFAWKTGKVAVKRVNSILGVGTIPERTGNATTPRRMNKTTSLDVDYKTYELIVPVDNNELEETAELASMIPEEMGRGVMGTYRAAGSETLNSAFDAAVSATHATDLGVRSNKVASAFDRSAVEAAEVLAHDWVDPKGLPADFSANGFNLAVSSARKHAAIEVLGSSVSSSEMQTNAVMGLADFSVEDCFDSAGDFLLVSKTWTPFVAFDRDPPTFSLMPDPYSVGTWLYRVRFSFGSKVNAEAPDGLIGGTAS